MQIRQGRADGNTVSERKPDRSNLNRSGGWDRGERGSGKRPAEGNADARPWVTAPRRRGPRAGDECRSEVPTALLLLGVCVCA